MTISARIFELLSQQGKTQTALATSIGVRVATVTAWKKQGTDPSADLLAGIAEFFGVSVNYLCTGKEYAAADVRQGVFGDGNHHNAVNIGGSCELSEFESELLRIYATLDARSKNALLTFAYDLERGAGDNK